MINQKKAVKKMINQKVKKNRSNKKKNEDVEEITSFDVAKMFREQLNIKEKRINYVWKRNHRRTRNKILIGYEESCSDNLDDSLGSENLNLIGKMFIIDDDDRLKREIEALRILQGKTGILTPINILQKGKKVILVFPKLKKFKPSNENDISRGYEEVKEILNGIHKENIIHHDIKPSHIMQNEKGDIYVIDFDICRLPGEECDHRKFVPGTKGFKLPQTIPCSKETDFYSLKEVKKYWKAQIKELLKLN